MPTMPQVELVPLLSLLAQQKKSRSCSEKAVGKARASLIGEVLRRDWGAFVVRAKVAVRWDGT
jgi:hypothetical protein